MVMTRSRAGIVTGWRSFTSVSRRVSRSPTTARQARLEYGLTGRAAALGWPASRMMVIDEDLGRSAANAAERPGFARLVAEITMGHVGLVLGLEMSRLARAGRDWHQLIELCSLAGALLADADGVYDPNWSPRTPPRSNASAHCTAAGRLPQPAPLDRRRHPDRNLTGQGAR